MRKGWIAGLVIFGIVALIFAYVFLISDFPKKKIFGCVPAGEVYENPSLGPDGNFGECCSGLVGISDSMNYDENCEYSGFLGGGKFCSDCGNGVCESWESKCNCEADCL